MLLITFAIALHCLLLFSDTFFSFVFFFSSLYFIASIWMNGEFIATTLEYNQFHFHHIIITHVVLLLFITLNVRFPFSSSPITVKCTVKLLLAIRPHWNFKPRGFQCRKIQMKIQHLKFILGYLFCRSNYHALNTHDASLLSSMNICINIGHNLIVISTRQRVHQMVLETIFYYVCKFQQKYHFNTPTPSTLADL